MTLSDTPSYEITWQVAYQEGFRQGWVCGVFIGASVVLGIVGWIRYKSKERSDD